MNKQRNILLGELVSCIIVVTSILLLGNFVYANAVNLATIAFLPTPWVFWTLINWKQEKEKNKPGVRWFTVLLILITVVAFFRVKPTYTYQQGMNLARDAGFTKLEETKEKVLFASELERTRLTMNSYFFESEKNGERYYVLVSPINGEVQIEKASSRNYIDIYREHF